MNQILVTKKLYITPELKRKKKIYKFEFIISVFIIGVLMSCYIYAEYDRNKSEEMSQDILASMQIEENDKNEENPDSNILKVVLSNDYIEKNEDNSETNNQQQVQTNNNDNEYTSQINGYYYKTVAEINIPKIGVNYPILKGKTGTLEETEALLKTAPCEFWGDGPNLIGNYSIVGHNYRNKRFFSKVPTLENGDIIEITANKETVQYAVYTKYNVLPEDTSCTNKETNGKREITLITCTDDSKERVIVKAREIK